MSETYIVKSGDTLSKIASKYNVNGGYMALAKYNNISNPNIINVGQKIVIPNTTTVSSKPATTTTNTNTSANTTKPASTPSTSSGGSIGVGSSVKITGTKYATGQNIPNWVKQNTYTVKEISGKRALIKEIVSWVNISDLKLVSGGTTQANTNTNSNTTKPTQTNTNSGSNSGPKTDNKAPDNDNESIILDVQLKSQKTDHTCGSASGAMAATTYCGANVTESDIWNNADGQGTYVFRVKDQINKHISKHGKGNDYAYTTTSNTNSNFLTMIRASLKLGAPVLLRIEAGKDVYGYKSNGHYVVVSGIYKKDGETKLRITDPWSSHWYSDKTGQIFDQSAKNIQNSLKGGASGDGYLILHKSAKA